jgi:hypothetical protein
MSISDEIRAAIRAAQQAARPSEDDPFKAVLDQAANGISNDDVKAEIRSELGPRWTLWLAPAYQPGRAAAMLEIVRTSTGVDVLPDPKQSADSPARLADILKSFVTSAAFLGSLEQLGEISKQPVEGYLRVAPGTVSRDDVILEVPPEIQRRDIAEKVGFPVTIVLRVANFPGTGTFNPNADYKVLESAGLVLGLTHPVERGKDSSLTLRGVVRDATTPT